MEELTEGLKYYPYYSKAYGAVLDGMVGTYYVPREKSRRHGRDGGEIRTQGILSPIAAGYRYNHYDDFWVIALLRLPGAST